MNSVHANDDNCEASVPQQSIYICCGRVMSKNSMRLVRTINRRYAHILYECTSHTMSKSVAHWMAAFDEVFSCCEIFFLL